jgi:hypothetical protein
MNNRITHALEAGNYSVGSPDFGRPTLTVTRPEELPAALNQHQTPVVIENTPDNARLLRDFELLLRWQRWKDTYRLLLIAILLVLVIMQMVMAKKYGLELGWYFKWIVFEIGGTIKLTPPP